MERMVVPGAELPRGQKRIMLFILQRGKGVLNGPGSAADQQEVGREIGVPAPFGPAPLPRPPLLNVLQREVVCFPSDM